MNYDMMNLKWKPPKRPNGIIEYFFVAYTKLNDLEALPISNDNCLINDVGFSKQKAFSSQELNSDQNEINKKDQCKPSKSELKRIKMTLKKTISYLWKMKYIILFLGQL